jgi:hypothetical protein
VAAHAADIVFGAVEVRLEDTADAAVFVLKVFDEVEGAVDVLVRLHVDFDAAVDGFGELDEGIDVLTAEFFTEVKAELGEFDGDGGGEGGGLDGVEGVEEEIAGGGGFIGGGDVLAEVIEGGEEAVGVEAPGDGEDILEGAARDEAGGEAVGVLRGFEPAPEGLLLGEEEEGLSEHGLEA